MSNQPQPLYQQAKQYILSQISNGFWQPNDRVCSEKELSEILEISRMTANRALRELTKEGQLVRIQGVGTFVASQKKQSALFEVKNIADEIKDKNGIHCCQILLLREEKATPEVATSLEITEGSSVFRSKILHMDRNIPIQLADRYVNPIVAPNYLLQNFNNITPSEYLLSIAPLTEVEHFIEAIIPDKQIRKILQLDPGEACLVLHRRTWSQNKIVAKTILRYSGSRFRLGGRFKANEDKNLVA